MSLEAKKAESVPSFKCFVLSHTLLTNELHKIFISRPQFFKYNAGQYIKLYLSDGTYRLYSIANAPDPDYLELHIKEPNHDNTLKDFLLTLKINQTLIISDAMGNLVFPPRLNLPTILIAGGSAFAPFKAILESLYRKGNVDVSIDLYWGLSKILDIYSQEDLQKIKDDVAWFNYKVILSSSDNNWKGQSGNLIDFIFGDFNNLEGFNMYVCGSKNMVTDIYYKALQSNLIKSNFYSDYYLDNHVAPPL